MHHTACNTIRNVKIKFRNLYSEQLKINRIKVFVVAFSVRVFCAVALLLMNILLTRHLGANKAGEFYFMLVLMQAAGTLAKFGLDNNMMRLGSPVWDVKDHGLLLGLGIQGIAIVSTLGLGLMAVLQDYSAVLGTEFCNMPNIVGGMRLMSYAIIPFGLAGVLCGLLRAVRLPATSYFVESGAVPVATSVALLAMSMFNIADGSLNAVLIIYVSATVFAVLAGCFALSKRIATWQSPKFASTVEILLSSWPLMCVSLVNYAVLWMSSFFLGNFTDAKSVALYNAAHRTSSVIPFILVVINGIVAPKFSSLFSQKKMAELEHVAINSTIGMVIFALPILLLVMIFPAEIMSVYGREFPEGAILLQIVAVGQIVNVASGSVGYLLMMTGHGNALRNMAVATMMLSLGMNLSLVPSLGALGAAVTTAVCLSFQNLAAAWLVYKKLGIRTLPGWSLLAGSPHRKFYGPKI